MRYAYPVSSPSNSFHILAKQHIALIRELGYTVEEIDVASPTAGSFMTPLLYDAGSALAKVPGAVAGFDLADSSLISKFAASLINSKAKAVAVPTEHNREVYRRSGVAVPIYVWRPYLDSVWFETPKCSRDFRGTGINILYFLLHSGRRKGVDIMAAALKELERRGVPYTLLLRAPEVPPELSGFKVKLISEWLDVECLKTLYYMADVVALPSRGGGLELNGLEALAVGTPVLVPALGPWAEYIPPRLYPHLAVKVAGFEPVYLNNQIHVGMGVRADPKDLADKIVSSLSIASEVRRERQWLLSKYGKDAVKAEVAKTLPQILSLLGTS
ncbi:MAG: glycosyltransferase [Thermoproteus sp.]